MAKLPHQSTVPPVDGQDAATKADGGAAEALQTTGAAVDVAAAAPPTVGQVLKATGATAATWQAEAGGGAADALATTGADVVVNTAAPPTTGQALVATSPTAAEWSDVAASGPLAAAQGDYLQANTSGASVPADNTAVTFATTASSRGLVLQASDTQIPLAAGRTYRLAAGLRINGVTAEFLAYQFYDVTGATLIGSGAVNQDADRAVASSDQQTAVAYITPTVDSLVELRVTVSGGSGTLSDVSYLEVVEIGAVQADVVGGLEFMDVISATGDTQSVLFGAGGDGAHGRALDGEIDGDYVMTYSLPDPGATVNVEVRPNSIDPTVVTEFQGTRVYGGQTSGSIEFAAWQINGQGNTYSEHGRIEILNLATGTERSFVGASSMVNGTTQAYGNSYYGTWSNTTTAITSLQVRGSTGTTIKSGALFTLWRRTRSNMRADTAAVYERMAMETVDPGALTTTERTVGHSIYGGSVVGVSLRVEDAVTAGDITVNVKVDGSTVLTAVLDTTNTTSKIERLAIGIAKFAADKNISVEFVPTSYDNAGSIPSAVTVQVHLTNDVLITQNDRVVARTELSANATTLTLTGLDGDNDEEYEIVGRLDKALAAASISLAINGSSVNVHCRRNVNNTIVDSTVGLLFNTGIDTVQKETTFIARFHVKRGNMRRAYTMQAMQFSVILSMPRMKTREPMPTRPRISPVLDL